VLLFKVDDIFTVLSIKIEFIFQTPTSLDSRERIEKKGSLGPFLQDREIAMIAAVIKSIFFIII
jgi:hypothetical protein